ncbi:MAG: hypothetical protein IT457_09555 [Planctomycetes bacterium]|jgi:hypothetical protein|nr:hypothetical protein [Planctomycetota bacterium]
MARKKEAAPAKKAEVRTLDADGVEVVKSGMGFEDGIVLTTFLLLLGAVVSAYFVYSRYMG